MHSAPRGGACPTKAYLLRDPEQSRRIAATIRRALQLRRQPIPVPITPDFDKEYEVVETALLTNPDEYTLWSFRREVFEARIQQRQQQPPDETGTGTGTDKHEKYAMQLWEYELNLTMKTLLNHPKAYPAWQHRIWLLQNASASVNSLKASAIQSCMVELKLTDNMLHKDGRNFHGWAHRMRVRSMLRAHGVADDERKELVFVRQKIGDDFANYSAWHHRSVLLPRVHEHVDQKLIDQELELVKQAFYTEPDVQSVWFYHRWLLAGAPDMTQIHDKLFDPFVVKPDIVQKELVTCDELLDIEPDATHAWQNKAHMHLQLGQHEEAWHALDKLEQLDPMRRGYYLYMKRKVNKA